MRGAKVEMKDLTRALLIVGGTICVILGVIGILVAAWLGMRLGGAPASNGE